MRATLSTFNASYSRCCSSPTGGSWSWSRAAVISSELRKVSRVTCHNPCRVQTHFFAMLCLPNFAQNLLHFAQISTYLHIQLAQLASFVCPQENIEYIYPAELRPLLIKIWNEMKISILSSLHSERMWFSVSQQLPAERGLERLM